MDSNLIEFKRDKLQLLIGSIYGHNVEEICKRYYEMWPEEAAAFEPVAEPAEPSAHGNDCVCIPCLDKSVAADLEKMAQPVAGEGPQDFTEADLVAIERGSFDRSKLWRLARQLRERTAERDAYDTQRKYLLKKIKGEGTPKLEEIADTIMRIVRNTENIFLVRSKIINALRPFITPACAPEKEIDDAKQYMIDVGRVDIPNWKPHGKLKTWVHEFSMLLRVATPASTGEANGWISAEERLPQNGVPVLFAHHSEDEVNVLWGWLDERSWGPSWNAGDVCFEPKFVTHWQPLPPAPTSVPQAEPPSNANSLNRQEKL